MRSADPAPCAQWLNLAPSSNLRLALPHVRLAGLQGWPGVAEAVGKAYWADIYANQVLGLMR